MKLLGSICLLTVACGGYVLLVMHVHSPWTLLAIILACAWLFGTVLTRLN